MCTLMFLKVQVDFNDLGENNYQSNPLNHPDPPKL